MLDTHDLVRHSDDVFFAASGVTNGDLLRGVCYTAGGAITHSIVMRAKVRARPDGRPFRTVDTPHISVCVHALALAVASVCSSRQLSIADRWRGGDCGWRQSGTVRLIETTHKWSKPGITNL